MRLAALFIVVSSVIFLILPDISQAQYISVKQTFWGTLQYTKNGVNFDEFGGGWKNLLAETESVEEAHNNILHSRNTYYAGMIFAAGGSVVLGIATSMSARNEEVDNAYWIAGGGSVLVSFICQAIARHKMDKGLLAYNKHISGISQNRKEWRRFGLAFSGTGIKVSYYFWQI
jgi:hypothetical protein